MKYDYSNINLGNSLVSLILNGEEQNAIKYENEMNRDLINNIKYNFNDWDEYLKYGGFPILARKINFRRLSTNIVDMIEKVVILIWLLLKISLLKIRRIQIGY